MKTFLRWAGGKQNLINDLLKHLPPNEKVNRYFEPFLGAASLFFATEYKKCYLSDINRDLINSYKSIKKNPEIVTELFNKHLHKFYKKKNYYYKIRDKFNNNKNNGTIEQAARFIFLIHTSYNGIYRVNSSGKYNVPVGDKNPSFLTDEYLIEVSKKLLGTCISTKPYKRIKKLVKKGDLIYLDPPYPPLNGTSYFQHYTKDKFPENEQKKLATFANELTKKECFVMISNADTSLIRELYNDWNIFEFKVTRCISSKKERMKVKELIITNYGPFGR